jgi:hypothetical protein
VSDGLFYPDGCVRPNIPVREYRVVLGPDCEHVRVRRAEVIVMASSPENARRLAEGWPLPGTRIVSVGPAGTGGAP